MPKALRFTVAACVVALTLALPALAAAAPVPWQLVDITLHNERNQSLLLVAGELPPTTPLPFEAELAVPAGMQLEWIGEILGGAPEADPTLPYTKETVDGRDIYRFTLTQSRIVQIEGVVPGLSTFDGTTYATALAWTATEDVPSVRISQRLPRGSAITQASADAALMAGDETFSYYSKTVKDVKAGEVVDLTFAYTQPAPGAVSSSADSGEGSNALTVGIVVAALAILVGILVFALRQSPAVVAEVPSQPKRRASEPVEHDVHDHDPTQDEDEGEPVPPRARSKTLVPTLAVIAALVGAALLVGAAATKPTVQDQLVSKDYGSTSACATMNAVLVPNGGVDLTVDAGKVLDASFKGKDGIGVASLDVTTGALNLTYCSSVVTEAAVRQMLSSSGLVTLGAAPASAPATVTIQP